MGKINIKALSLSLGATWAIFVLFIGWASMYGWGSEMMTVLSSMYLGMSSTFVGGIIGAVWAFVDGAIAGALIALIYNKLEE